MILAELYPSKVQDLEAILYVGCSRACNHLIILASDLLPVELRGRLPGVR